MSVTLSWFYLRDTFRFAPHTGTERRAFHAQFMQDGNLDPDHAPPIGYAHLSTSAEFGAFFAPTFAEVALIGVDAFTGIWQDVLPTLTPNNAEA